MVEYMEKNFNFSGWTLRDLVQPLFRQKLVIILTIVLITTGTFVGLKMQTPLYEASVKMYIRGQAQTVGLTYEGIGSFRIHMTQMEIVKSETVLKRVVETLKLYERPLDYESNYSSLIKKRIIQYYANKKQKEIENLDPEQKKEFLINRAIMILKDSIQTELIRNTDIFYIIVKDFDRNKAIEIANVVSRAYTIFDQQQQLAELALKYGDLHPTVQQLRDNISFMNNNLSGKRLPDIEAIGTASVKIIEQASSDNYPIGKPKIVIFITAFLGSIFASFAIALMFDFMDKTFHGTEDIEKTLMIPTIGFIAHKSVKEKFNIKNPDKTTDYTESYNKLTEQIIYILKTKTIKSFLFSFYDDNKTNDIFIANISYLLSKNYSSIVIVDCSRYNESLLKLLENEYSEAKSIANEKKITNRVNDNLTYIAIQFDNKNPLQQLQSSSFEEFVKDLKNRYELVIMICSKITEYHDTIVVSRHLDGIIPFIHEGVHKKQLIINSVFKLKEEKINIIGTILYDRYFSIPEVIYNRM